MNNGKNTNTFNMVPRDDKLKKFGKVLAKVFAVIILCILLLSISPKNSVRMTMVLSGVNPVKAVKSSPTYLVGYSREMKTEVYALPDRQAYEYDIGDKVQYFKIHTFLIFHFATPTALSY